MKLKRIEINNINSIQNAVIDFENLMPADEHVFLIWGPSGSGKTTILDAISLALFKRVPRLEGIPNKNSKYEDSELQFSESRGREISTDDIRQYLKRGTKNGSTALSFVGNDGNNYTASLSFSINKNNVLNEDKWILVTPTGILDKKRHVEDKIREITGMNYDQFCRTTLLAQGEFTKFMKSDQQSKADILQKLTDTGIFSSIGMRIFEKYSQKKKEYEALQIQNEGIERLTDDEIVALNEDTEHLNAEIAAISKEISSITAKSTWIKREIENDEKLRNAESELNEAKKDLESLEFKNDENDVKLWECTEIPRNNLLNINRLEDIKKDFDLKRKQLKSDFDTLTAGINFVITEIEKYGQKKEEIESQYNLYSSRAEIFENNAFWQEKLKDFASNQSQITVLSSEKTTISNELKEICKEAGNIQIELESAEKDLIPLNNKLSELKTATQGVDYHKLVQLCLNINSSIDELAKIRFTADTLKSHQTDLLNLENEINALKDAVKSEETSLSESEKTLDEAKNSYENAENVYKASLNSVNKFAKEMRATLKSGDTCPVCGQKISEILSNEAVDASVAQFKLKVDIAEKEYKELKSQYESKLLLITQSKTKINGKTSIYSQKTKDKELFLAELKQNAEKYNIAINPTIYEQIDAKSTELRREFEHNSNIKIDFEEKSTQIKETEDKIKSITNQITLNKDKKSKLDSKMSAKRTAIELAGKRIEELKTKLGDLEAEISSSLIQYYPKWIEKAETAAADLEKDKKSFLKITENRNKIVETLQKLLETKSKSESLQLKLSEKYGWKLSNGISECDDLVNKWFDLDRNCEILSQNIANTDKEIISNRNTLDSFLESEKDVTLEKLNYLSTLQLADIQKKRDETGAKRERLQKADGSLKSVREDIRLHAENKPEFAENDTLDFLEQSLAVLDNQKNANSQKIGANNDSLRKDAENKRKYADTLRKLDELRQVKDRWERLNSVFGDAKGNTFKLIAQSFILNRLLDSTNYFLSMLSDRYQLTCPGNNLLILVKDKYLNDAARPVEMVSGGESFIISIALALGLSNMAMQGFSSDYIFIDEGISQLDGTRCDNVVSTLQQLHRIINCNIGIISHLDKLAEMIPTKILVQPVSQGTSCVQTP